MGLIVQKFGGTSVADAERIRIRGFLVFDVDDAGRITRLRGYPSERSVGIDSTFRPEPAPERSGEGA